MAVGTLAPVVFQGPVNIGSLGDGLVMIKAMSDLLKRCDWCGGIPELIAYHDAEWGVPVHDDQRLFEKLCLEAFQCGLSWRTVLNKRARLRAVFHDFDFYKVAKMTGADVARLLDDPGIIRHRGKIEAVIHNAGRAQALVAEAGSLSDFIWQYQPDPHSLPPPQSVTMSAESRALSRDLKKRGWKFVGPTTMYAFMQSMGLINDHALDCAFRQR